MADRFYLNSVLSAGAIVLEGAEAHHLGAVRRLRPGDRVCLFNGDGHEYPARVQSVGRRQVALEVLGQESPVRELGFRLEIAAPMPKGDRAQFLIEKLTELGVTRFIPLRTQRSTVHPGEARREKWERYVIEASKQCGRNVLMKVEELADWENWHGCGDLPPMKIMADLGEPPLPRCPGQDQVCAVGPEGGFTPQEVEQARAAGWQLTGLGARVLRVETAALLLAARAIFE